MNKKGISYVEIIIATAIFLVAAIPLWGLMGSSHQQVVRSADEIKASQIAIEILEQIENTHNVKCLPDDVAEFDLQSGGVIKLGSEDLPIEIKVGDFEDYMSPKLYLSSNPHLDTFTDQVEIGRVVTLELEYNSKEVSNQKYILRGFVSANE